MSTLSGTKPPPICPIRKWFGVKTRSPLGSSLTPVKGLEFNRPSPLGQIVYNCSSLTSASLVTTKIARFANLIIGSKGPPKCGGAGPTHSLIGDHPLYLVLVHSSDQTLQFPRCPQVRSLRSQYDKRVKKCVSVERRRHL